MNQDFSYFQKWQKELGGSFFSYDLDAMLVHLKKLRGEGVRVWYACKANPLSAILQTVNEAGLSFDVASLGELEQVIAQGIQPERILLTGPGKNEKFLRRAFAHGVRIFVAESHAQLLMLEKLAQEYSSKPKVILRLQMEFEKSGSNILGGTNTSVFGLDAASWGKIHYPQLEICGVHVFQWGNIQDLSRLVNIWEKIATTAKDFAAKNGFPLQVLDLGGGLGVPYHENGFSFSWDEVEKILPQIKKISGAGELWLELGRYAVAPFGTYITRIQEIKTVRGEHFVICEGGAQHLLRPALVGESFPVRALISHSAKLQTTRVHGPLCTTLDSLGSFELPENLQPGDLLAFGQCGAYGFTESMPFFLCHDLPGEIILRHGRVEVLRPVATAQSWLR